MNYLKNAWTLLTNIALAPVRKPQIIVTREMRQERFHLWEEPQQGGSCIYVWKRENGVTVGGIYYSRETASWNFGEWLPQPITRSEVLSDV